MSYIDEHIDYLAGHEGVKGALERVEDSSKTAAPYGLDNPPIPRKEKESDRAYVKRVLEHFEVKAKATLGNAYDNAPNGVKRAILDSYYNSGRLYPGQIASLKGTNGVSDYVGFAKNTLDIVSANDPKTNSAGILKGLANRKAATYNLMANEVEGLSPITGGELIDVGGKAQLIYNTDKDPIAYNFDKPLHSKSNAGALNVKSYKKAQPLGVAPGVSPFEAQLQAAENENAALMPTYGASKVAAAPAVSPNFKVAGGYNPNKVDQGIPSVLPPEEVITEKETVTEEGPGFYDRFTSGIKELLPFNEGGPVKNTNNFPNWYTNPNDIDLSESGIEILPPDQIITPNRDDTIVEEEIITQPPQYSMQEAARRSMMLGNEEQRMADYNYARAAAQVNPESYALPQMQAAQRIMGGYTEGGRVSGTQGLASLGRGGDSTLVHMQPREVAGLQQLAQANGTSLTRNPMTGYPEAFSLGGMFKAALPIAAGYFTGGAATPFLGAGTAASSAITAGALTGAGVAAATGDDPILGAVTGGMGGYSGMGLESAVANMPAATVPMSGNMGQQIAADAAYTGSLGGMQVGTPTANIGAGGTGMNVGGGGFGAQSSAVNNPMSLAGSTPGGTIMQDSPLSTFDRAIAGAKKASGIPGGETGIYSVKPDGTRISTQMQKAVAGTTPQALMKLGSPIASMGLGGLEESDFMVKPDFNDPRDKYDPRSKLNLNRDTGISEAMSRDTGLRLLAKGGYINGPGDGMSDDIPATINGDEPAALADGEFVIPADVVSHLGNGSSEAGSKQLHVMMDRIRKARTGRKSQGKEIKPGKYMPR